MIELHYLLLRQFPSQPCFCLNRVFFMTGMKWDSTRQQDQNKNIGGNFRNTIFFIHISAWAMSLAISGLTSNRCITMLPFWLLRLRSQRQKKYLLHMISRCFVIPVYITSLPNNRYKRMEELLCPICYELLHRPHSLNPCKHIFCDPCLRRLNGARFQMSCL